jgi:DNA-binding FadR family transcriptional regulator
MEELVKEINTTIPEIKDFSMKTHRKIFNALNSRDKKEVAKWMGIHIDRVREYYNRYSTSQSEKMKSEPK